MHPRDLPPCDLVMKGGAASGVVYPGAVLELSTRYRFEKLGGTSAGALAAGFAAAAEFARQRAGRLELRGFSEIMQDLGQPGFVASLFQPAPAGRPLLELIVALRSARGSRRRQLRVLAVAAFRYRPRHVVAATLGAAATVALLGAALQYLPIVLAVILVLLASIALMLLGAWAILAPLAAMLRGTWRALPGLGFGLCPGLRQRADAPDALIEWLHAKIQHCAELPGERPLTFAMLAQQGIGLQMVATDLGRARPVRIPFEEEQYMFTPRELRALFPEPVVEHVLDAAGVPAADRDGSRAWFVPAMDLPVLVGARLSSSLPLVFSALRLYSAEADARTPVESLISDGGITSNFPIHFFDDWLPSHPTFGLDLLQSPDHGRGDRPPVLMPTAENPSRQLSWSAATTLGGFLHQIDDASRNWRDELQAELPGFRDRVCQIHIGAREGGLNLDANPESVARLLERGRAAGREILEKFDWDQHRFVRYLTLMEMLQDNFALLAERFGDYRGWLGSDRAQSTGARAGRDAAWLAQAEQATARLIEHAPTRPSFDSGEKPRPEPAMRIGPRV